MNTTMKESVEKIQDNIIKLLEQKCKLQAEIIELAEKQIQILLGELKRK